MHKKPAQRINQRGAGGQQQYVYERVNGNFDIGALFIKPPVFLYSQAVFFYVTIYDAFGLFQDKIISHGFAVIAGLIPAAARFITAAAGLIAVIVRIAPRFAF